jgi:hypothetical protein
MQTVWHLKGEKAGSFELLDDDAATELEAAGTAQICDGQTPLQYPENHPDYVPEAKPRRKYKNRAMTTDAPDA